MTRPSFSPGWASLPGDVSSPRSSSSPPTRAPRAAPAPRSARCDCHAVSGPGAGGWLGQEAHPSHERRTPARSFASHGPPRGRTSQPGASPAETMTAQAERWGAEKKEGPEGGLGRRSRGGEVRRGDGCFSPRRQGTPSEPFAVYSPSWKARVGRKRSRDTCARKHPEIQQAAPPCPAPASSKAHLGKQDLNKGISRSGGNIALP